MSDLFLGFSFGLFVMEFVKHFVIFLINATEIIFLVLLHCRICVSRTLCSQKQTKCFNIIYKIAPWMKSET